MNGESYTSKWDWPEGTSRLGISSAGNTLRQMLLQRHSVVAVCATDFPVRFRVLKDLSYWSILRCRQWGHVKMVAKWVLGTFVTVQDSGSERPDSTLCTEGASIWLSTACRIYHPFVISEIVTSFDCDIVDLRRIGINMNWHVKGWLSNPHKIWNHIEALGSLPSARSLEHTRVLQYDIFWAYRMGRERRLHRHDWRSLLHRSTKNSRSVDLLYGRPQVLAYHLDNQ